MFKRIVVASKIEIVEPKEEVCPHCGKKRSTLQVLGIDFCCEEGKNEATGSKSNRRDLRKN